LELLDKINELSEKIAHQFGLEVFKIYFKNEEDGKVLHIELTKKEGVGLQDIVNFTENINPRLDEMSELDFPYSLDCSSPGAEREIEISELDELSGEYMEITCPKGTFTGTLSETTPDTITLKYFLKGRPKKEIISKDQISKAQLKVKL